MIAFAVLIAAASLFQSAPAPAKTRLEFDVASVEQNKSGGRGGDRVTANFPLGPGDVYRPNGGYFAATNQPLVTYILFAYKVQNGQLRFLIEEAPSWVRTERFDIKARADGNPTKDEMREMMQSLLAERFHLAVHTETRNVPLYELVLVKPGITGPQLRPHPADASCPVPGTPQARTKPEDEFPQICGGMQLMRPSAPGLRRAGARDVSMDLIADSASTLGGLDRPVLNKTGLTGSFDFAFEWAPDASRPLSTNADSQYDPAGPSFLQALKTHLGLKLESRKGPFDVFVIDHVEHPTEN